MERMRKALKAAGVETFAHPSPGVRFVAHTQISNPSRAREHPRHGVLGSCHGAEHARDRDVEKAKRWARSQIAAIDRKHEAEEAARQRELRRQPCGAKTRAGHPCKRKGIGRGNRCANHGGLSAGPKTAEGRERIAEALRRRWAECRAQK